MGGGKEASDASLDRCELRRVVTPSLFQDFKLSSMFAHARATPSSADLLPGILSQPPFSMKDPCSQVLTFFSRASWEGASTALWNCATQMGASAATTAELACVSAIFLAVPPSIHPPQLKPTIIVATAPTTSPCNSRFSDWPRSISGVSIGVSFPNSLGKMDSSLFEPMRHS